MEINPGEVSAAFFAALADHDVDRAFSLVAEDAEVTIYPADLRGRATVEGRQFFADTLAAFPDLLLTPKRTVVTNDGRVITELKFEGTQAADYLGIVNQEKHLDVDQAWVLSVRDGLIRSITGYWCQNQVYRRLAVKRIDQVAIV